MGWARESTEQVATREGCVLGDLALLPLPVATELRSQGPGHPRRGLDRGACVEEQAAGAPSEGVLDSARHLVPRTPGDLRRRLQATLERGTIVIGYGAGNVWHCAEPSFSMRMVRPFLRVIREREDAPEARLELLEQCDPDARVPVRVAVRLLDDAVARTGDPDLGLRAALATERGEYDLLEFIASSSSTYRELISLISRYIRLLNDALELRVECCGGHGIAQLKSSVPVGRTGTDFGIASIYLCFARRASPERDRFWREFWFTHEEPADTRLYQRVFGAGRVRFSAPLDGMVFDEQLLDLSPSNADPRLHDLLCRLAEERIAKLPTAESLTQRVRVLVSQQLGEGHPSAQHVAGLLHMSRRTLTRRLDQEGTTFKAVVDRVRRELAQRYLAIENLGVSEIAPRLGFSDSAAFHRAFRRWCGRTPSDYRREYSVAAARRDPRS